MRTTILTLAAALALPAFAQNPLLDQGRTALERHDYRQAAIVLERAVAEQPKSAEAHYLLGTAYGRIAEHAAVLRQPDLAWKTKTEFERAVENDPNHLRARSALIEYYLLAPAFLGGDDSKAYRQATEIRARDAEQGHRAFAQIYEHEKRFDLARDEYVLAVHDGPQSPQAHYAYAVFLESRREYKLAADEFETAVRLDPMQTAALFHLGRIAALTKQNLPRGAEALRRYLAAPSHDEDDPTLAQAQSILGTINEKIASQPEALAGRGGALRRASSPRR